MSRGKIKTVSVHIVPTPDFSTRTEKINELYVTHIKRRMEAANLSANEQLTVIDGILAALKTVGK